MRVAIIMSTYNGEKYIKEQLDSIINQEDIEWDLYIRDDGSSDYSIEILREYSQKDKRIHLNIGKNKGYKRSFIEELLSVREKYDYYAFSDQDDYWEKDKIKKAIYYIERYSSENIPTIYYSNLKKYDDKLNYKSITKLEKRKRNLKSNFLRRSIAGCTMVFNHNMYNILKKGDITDEAIIRGHDSLLISLCYAINGNVLFDSNSYIRYRVHNSNTSASSNTIFMRIKKELRFFLKNSGEEAILAKSLINNWGSYIDEKNKNTLDIVKDSKIIRNRLKIFFDREFVTGDIRLTIVGKLKVILGLM